MKSLKITFHDYDESYFHLRKYFWDISSTLNQEFDKKFINYSIKNKQKINQETKIEIPEEIMRQINKKHFYSRQKGRELYMIVTSKIYENQ